jgi:Glycerophosphoryl diester phosphodiesterase
MVPLAGAARTRPTDLIVIAHRGASGYLPEHTLAAYALAIEMGADYIEPDLVMTRDGILVVRHENEIGGTTDVSTRPEYGCRRTSKVIDGNTVTGWFTEDFTLAELKTLRAVERIPSLRPSNARFDGVFEVPTLTEVLDLVRGANERFHLEAGRDRQRRERVVGVYPETKHPSYFASIGLPMERRLVEELELANLNHPHSPVYIQSFEVANLKLLRTLTALPLIQLLSASGKPYDFVVSGDSRSYADLAAKCGLADIAAYANGVGVEKPLVIPTDAKGGLARVTALVEDAHAAGLVVHAWTFRAENAFLPCGFKGDQPSDPAQFGDLSGEIRYFLAAGIDGFFTDMPDLGDSARNAFLAGSCGDGKRAL